jgi:CDP-6-deoxy-D-xylo-4-hexulose-3-dehydrase
MADQVRGFEVRFARYVGAKHAVMVNSGSSANLLALAAASNPARKTRLKPGDEVLIPAVCWSTSLWPIVQMGLKPVFVDANPETLNMDADDLRRKITRSHER